MSLPETVGELLVRPLLGPFPPAHALALARRGSLQRRLDEVASDPQFAGMGIALIDLTGGRMGYAYALRERARVYPATDRTAAVGAEPRHATHPRPQPRGAPRHLAGGRPGPVP